MPSPHPFPNDFLWGAATSAHQVEGRNRDSDWWAAEQAGRLPFASGEACRHLDLYRADFDLARSLGHNAHRLSLEWSRIEPREGRWSDEALAHYRTVLQSLRERSLEPVVTLHHFTNPAWLAERGGWRRREAVELFARYVAKVAEELDGLVRYWITVNEPTVYVMQGLVNGAWPPFRREAWREAVRVYRHLARAHVAAHAALHARSPGCRVGFAHGAPLIQPCDPTARRDRITAALRDRLLNRSFPFLVRGRRSLDFIGINYYTRAVVRSTGWGPRGLLGRACKEHEHQGQGPLSDLGWEVYPAGFRPTLESFARYRVPLLVTENGVATRDETLRSSFLADHLQVLEQAVRDGLPVIGYLYWSLIDNFEWDHGTAPRFGLAEVDYQTQVRTPRPAAELLRRAALESQSL